MRRNELPRRKQRGIAKNRDRGRRKQRGIRPVGAVRSPWKMMYSAYDESTTGF
jgi:hypothetical protein